MKNDFKEVSFYKLTTLPIQKAVPKLIEKIYYSGQKLVIITEDELMMKMIDDGLWAYSTKHFIPHATCHDEYKEDQPIYITTNCENPNQSNMLMILGKMDLDKFSSEKLIFMFDGNHPEYLDFARKQWKTLQATNTKLIYWQQKLDGTWEKINN